MHYFLKLNLPIEIVDIGKVTSGTCSSSNFLTNHWDLRVD